MINEKFLEESKKYDQDEINVAFQSACLNGDLGRVEYLCTSPQLKFHAEIHCDKEMGLRAACMNGHLSIVEFLTSSSKLKDHADISYDDGTPLAVASLNNNLSIVKYILESPQFKKQNKKSHEDRAFLAACKNGHLNVVYYFIYERNIKKLAENIFLRNIIEHIKEIDKMFNQRELKASLEKELACTPSKKPKIKL
jgi:ankyrin repeat protein